MSREMKENANLVMNVLLLIITGVGGFLAKEVYQTSNETRERVAVIQSQQATYQRDVAGVQAEVATLRTRIQANEIEIIKLQQKRNP